MSFNDFARSLWNRFSWEKHSFSRQGDSVESEHIPSVEKYNPNERAIDTSVDCYITGQYIDGDGKIFSIRVRYSVRVKYSFSTFREVIAGLRKEIIAHFERNYSDHGFSITDVFIPDLVMPQVAVPLEFYRGRRAWRLLTRRQQRDTELDTARDVYKSRVRGIMRRYSIRKGR